MSTPYGVQVAGVFLNSGGLPGGYRLETTTITDVLQVASEYTLSYAAGNGKSDTGAARGGVVAAGELLAGTSVIASTAVTTSKNDMTEGASLTFTTGLDHPNIGETLGIRLMMPSGDWHWRAYFDNVVLDVVSVTPIFSTGSTTDWNDTATWNPAQIPTAADLVIVNSGHQVNSTGGADAAKWLKVEHGSSKVTVDSGAALTAFDVLATAGGAVDVIGSLTSTGSLAVHTGSTMDVTGTLAAPVFNSSGVVTIGSAATTTGVAQTNLLDGSITGAGALNLGGVHVNGGALNAGGAVATTALTYTSGSINLGGNDLNATDLTVNSNLDVSGSTVTAATAVTVNNSTLTVGNDIATQTLTLNGGNVAGGAVTADTKYSFTNIANYTGDITGATAELIIGEGWAVDNSVKLSGVNSYGGITRIDRGVLEVDADAANLGTGRLEFNAARILYPSGWVDYRNKAAVLQTSGTFARKLGAANGVYFRANGGFAAGDAPLTVTLERADGAAAPLQVSYPTNKENGIAGGQWGSPTANAMVELTNDLLCDSYHLNVQTFDNPNSSKDITLFSGDISQPSNTLLINKSGPGTLWLTGTNTGFQKVYSGGGNQGVIRAVDGVGLSPTALLQFNGGVFESNGTFDRQIGNVAGNGVDPGKVYFNKEGGFSAYGGTLDVSLVPTAGGSPGDPLTWNGDLRGKSLYMGSQTADNVATFANAIDGANGHRYIHVSGNSDSDDDYVVMAGDLTNIKNFYVRGTSNPGELRIGNLTNTGGVFFVDTGAICKLNGVHTSNNAARVQSGGSLGGTGTLSKGMTVYSTGIVAPGNSVGTLNVTANTQLQNDSIYEWEVGLGATDILNITGAGALDLDKFILKILDAGGYDIDAADELTVFTYETGVTTVQTQLGAVTFDTSALDPAKWNAGDGFGGLALTDDAAGRIYLTGLVRLLDVIDVVVPAGDTLIQPLQAGQKFGDVTIGDAGLLTVDSDLTDISVTNLTLGGGSTIEVAAGTQDVTLSVSGVVDNGETGIATLGDNSGTPGVLQVNLTLESSASLDWTLGADGPQGHYIDIWGDTTIMEGAGPTDGITINVLDGGGGSAGDAYLIAGVFNAFDLSKITVNLPAGWSYTALAVEYAPVPDTDVLMLKGLVGGVQGDTDGDGDVDEDDYDNLLAQFGGPGGVESADLDGNGTVDMADFRVLREFYGAGVPTAPEGDFFSPTTTPEPATVGLLALGGLAVLKRRRRKRRSR